MMKFLRHLSLSFAMRLPALFVLLNTTSFVQNNGIPFIGDVAISKPVYSAVFGDEPISSDHFDQDCHTAYAQLNFAMKNIISSHNAFVGEKELKHSFSELMPQFMLSAGSLSNYCFNAWRSSAQKDDLITFVGKIMSAVTLIPRIVVPAGDVDVFCMTAETWRNGLNSVMNRRGITIDTVSDLQRTGDEAIVHAFMHSAMCLFDRLRLTSNYLNPVADPGNDINSWTVYTSLLKKGVDIIRQPIFQDLCDITL